MDDSMDGNDKTGGTLRTRGPAPRGGEGRVKQSFSHGRSKSVVVETKARKRVLKPTEGGPSAAGGAAPAPRAPAPAPRQADPAAAAARAA
ncbi:MAG: translation initiation factor IF-2 associated domain-containing protein, partial [Pseudomonadota bacterium]|nr:translation initiation factor IF-2 associated domain-containing protein [Pseudomonadota bacterium]